MSRSRHHGCSCWACSGYIPARNKRADAAHDADERAVEEPERTYPDDGYHGEACNCLHCEATDIVGEQIAWIKP